VPRRVAVALLAPPVWAPPGVDLQAWRLALAEDLLDVFAAMVEVESAVAVLESDAAMLAQIGWPGLRGYVLPALDVATVFAAVGADGYDQAVLLAADAPDLPGMLIAKLLRPLTTRPVAAAPATNPGPPTREDAENHEALAREEAEAEGAPAPVRAPAHAPGQGEVHDGVLAGRDDSQEDSGAVDDQGRGRLLPIRQLAADGDPPVVLSVPARGGLLGLSATIPAASWLPAVGLDDLTPQSLRRLAPHITDVAPAPGWHRLRSPTDLARLDPRLEGWDATRSLLSTPTRPL
jgi:hypothetical protein